MHKLRWHIFGESYIRTFDQQSSEETSREGTAPKLRMGILSLRRFKMEC